MQTRASSHEAIWRWWVAGAVAEMTGWQTIKLTFIAICAKAEITSKSASNPPTPKEEEYFIRII